MLEYLVFNTEAQARAAAAAIYKSGADFARFRGRTVSDGIASIRIDGTEDLTAVRSTDWYIPRQRLTDGKWVILHPQYHPDASDPEAGPFLAPALTGLVSETGRPEWFETPE